MTTFIFCLGLVLSNALGITIGKRIGLAKGLKELNKTKDRTEDLTNALSSVTLSALNCQWGYAEQHLRAVERLNEQGNVNSTVLFKQRLALTKTRLDLYQMKRRRI